MDRDVMRASGKDPAGVIIIPTAAVTGPAKAANDGVTHFAALGGNASQLMVLERIHANDLNLIAPARDADVVYFTGGNPDHLLDTLRGSALLWMLKDGMDRGLVLGGSSAGAMVMGSLMRRPPLYTAPAGGDAKDRWWRDWESRPISACCPTTKGATPPRFLRNCDGPPRREWSTWGSMPGPVLSAAPVVGE